MFACTNYSVKHKNLKNNMRHSWATLNMALKVSIPSFHSRCATSGGRKVSPAAFWKQKKSTLILWKSVLILEKGALFVCIYGLNSHLKCSFKSIMVEKHQFFSPVGLFYVIHETFFELSLFQETSLAIKILQDFQN